MITSLQHPVVKHLTKLRSNRDYREEHATLVLEGIIMVGEVCRSLPPKVILVSHEALVPAGINSGELLLVSEEILAKITGTPSPEGIVAEVAIPEQATLKDKRRVLGLDGVNDPGNLGALLRTALVLGFEGVYLFHDCCDPYNDKALRAAKGATFRLPMRMGSWQELQGLAEKEQWACFAADIKGAAVDSIPFPERLLLILGSEAHGLSSEVKESCQAITIPQQGVMDSLNVAIAGGILMYLMGKKT
jgi:TrmH family RNA methyltransferase